MTAYKNESEPFHRHMNRISIFEKDKISYDDDCLGIYPSDANSYFSFCLPTNDFSRSIKTIQKNGQVYYSIDISFSLIDLSLDRKFLFEDLSRKNAFAVVLHSNVDSTIIGNHLFPMSITVSDGTKEDNSGKDSLILQITGDTILYPRPSPIEL